MTARLSLESLAVSRGGRRLFEGLNAVIEPGTALALTGRNGAGKTSLLRVIAGLLRPDQGAVRFGDLDPRDAQASAIHLVGHQDGLKPARTAGEELSFWSGWFGGSDDASRQAAERLGLTTLLSLEVRRLSAGQRRRLALARLLAAPRPIWLLDEPMAPLDADWRGRFGAIMAEHLASGGLIVAAVHDPLPLTAETLEIGA